ncbi:MAG: LysE family translocator [Nocardiopsaceae bacterium]|nr:LysE family translocator [Nocardiopsaceae bacterium]
MLAAVLAFAGVAAIINVTPGLDTMMVLRSSVSGGRLTGFVSGIGINVGCLAWGLAAAAGASGLLLASRDAYDALRVAGAAYLTWMGCRALWQSRRRPGEDAPPQRPAREPREPTPRRFAAFRSGVLTNLLNPKAGIFYMSLLPQFIPHGSSVFSTSMLLTLVDVAELLVWFCVVSMAAAALSDRLHRMSFRRRMEQLSGLVFIGFAVDLVMERSL